MAVDDSEIIDLIGIDKITSMVILTISDHLDWENSYEHLFILQSKLNAYIAFIENEEIYEVYPDAIGKRISIEVSGQYDLIPEAVFFYSEVNKLLKDVDLTVKFKKVNLTHCSS